MIDPIKKFVEQNREAFDHIEPPADALKLIKDRLKAQAAGELVKEDTQKKIVPLYNRTKWLVAASILFAITATLILFNKRSGVDVSELANQSKTKITKKQPADRTIDLQKSDKVEMLAGTTPSNHSESAIKHSKSKTDHGIADYAKKGTNHQDNRIKTIENAVLPEVSTKDLYARLADSSSSSIRLSAILEINKTNQVSINTLDILAKTLNNDSNSNVRLAALDVLAKYADDHHASSLLVGSLSTQKDPLVQLGLIALLGKMESVKIDDRLFALADDPNTFDAVKNEAYAVLLSQNKL